MAWHEKLVHIRFLIRFCPLLFMKHPSICIRYDINKNSHMFVHAVDRYVQVSLRRTRASILYCHSPLWKHTHSHAHSLTHTNTYTLTYTHSHKHTHTTSHMRERTHIQHSHTFFFLFFVVTICEDDVDDDVGGEKTHRL